MKITKDATIYTNQVVNEQGWARLYPYTLHLSRHGIPFDMFYSLLGSAETGNSLHRHTMYLSLGTYFPDILVSGLRRVVNYNRDRLKG